MVRILPKVLDTKYENILREERNIAKEVASAVLSMGNITVWEIIIPIMLLFRFMRYKRAKEVFVLNLLFTKKLALEAARDMVGESISRQQAIRKIMEKTDEILASDTKGLYSKRIREKQLREIEVLIDHYKRLLESDHKDYPSMLKGAYCDWGELEAFLERLKKAEKDVNRAAHKTLGTQPAGDMFRKMEAASHEARLRKAEEAFFGSVQVG